MPIEYLIGIAASIILNAVKNPQHKTQVRSVLLKIFNTIKNAYPGDPDFQ